MRRLRGRCQLEKVRRDAGAPDGASAAQRRKVRPGFRQALGRSVGLHVLHHQPAGFQPTFIEHGRQPVVTHQVDDHGPAQVDEESPGQRCGHKGGYRPAHGEVLQGQAQARVPGHPQELLRRVERRVNGAAHQGFVAQHLPAAQVKDRLEDEAERLAGQDVAEVGNEAAEVHGAWTGEQWVIPSLSPPLHAN
jgi:hypothetical protein